ncbi:hypothetical protein EXA21_16605 [Vibrio cincinnatiensis]|uniref:hypothetical protein n=1 Tax=Vibrio cincinnatiensis TaxID=675 RepID=UPI001EE0EA86|nr:hypothetical protein [Vibrio cincinnatiensis]MCG3761052.1 hypothetical protein [Vibrio cincinnatiensis]MCG3764371.1 hypothetical protein [Vibrio cincinnatiensis]
MKKQVSHILFFSLASLLLVSAGILGINGLNSDFSKNDKVSEHNLMLDEPTVQHVLDTVRFCEEPCYEFHQYESIQEDNTQIDILSKTIVKVENKNGHFEDIDNVSIKKFPANKSLNLMIEKYTLKRKVINSNASFFVTMESFNTRIDRSDIFGIDIETNPGFETSLNANQIEQIKIFCSDEAILKSRSQISRPL